MVSGKGAISAPLPRPKLSISGIQHFTEQNPHGFDKECVTTILESTRKIFLIM